MAVAVLVAEVAAVEAIVAAAAAAEGLAAVPLVAARAAVAALAVVAAIAAAVSAVARQRFVLAVLGFAAARFEEHCFVKHAGLQNCTSHERNIPKTCGPYNNSYGFSLFLCKTTPARN